jgi:hypothetical protein
LKATKGHWKDAAIEIMLGKTLIIVGVILIIVGILLLNPTIRKYLGKLPGDIHIQKENFSIYIPITTAIIISIVLSILFNIFKK